MQRVTEYPATCTDEWTHVHDISFGDWLDRLAAAIVPLPEHSDAGSAITGGR